MRNPYAALNSCLFCPSLRRGLYILKKGVGKITRNHNEFRRKLRSKDNDEDPLVQKIKSDTNFKHDIIQKIRTYDNRIIEKYKQINDKFEGQIEELPGFKERLVHFVCPPSILEIVEKELDKDN